MNEQQFALQIRRALDESSSALPYRVTHRLAAAREAALAKMPPRPRVVTATSAQLAGAGASGPDVDWETPGRAWRITGMVLPFLIVVAGMATIAAWDASETAQELADVDAAMLTDDVPIAAYLDRGFGVFIKNNRQ
jgi:Protein of unknown function (DUF3619)